MTFSADDASFKQRLKRNLKTVKAELDSIGVHCEISFSRDWQIEITGGQYADRLIAKQELRQRGWTGLPQKV
jgi:hypothetical protein